MHSKHVRKLHWLHTLYCAKPCIGNPGAMGYTVQ